MSIHSGIGTSRDATHLRGRGGAAVGASRGGAEEAGERGAAASLEHRALARPVLRDEAVAVPPRQLERLILKQLLAYGRPRGPVCRRRADLSGRSAAARRRARSRRSRS